MSDGVRILVVDDEPEVRETLRNGLVALGHQVVVADSGVEALRLAGARGFDIVLLDLRMPDMDGLAVLEALKGRGVAAKMVILTGHAEVESAVTAMKLGAQDYLQKPIDLPELDGPGFYQEMERRDPELCGRVIFLTGDARAHPEQTVFAGRDPAGGSADPACAYSTPERPFRMRQDSAERISPGRSALPRRFSLLKAPCTPPWAG